MSKEAALVPFADRYPVLAEDPETAFTALTQNLPGAQLSPTDLTRWSLEGIGANRFKNKDGDRADVLEGVIVAARAGTRLLYLATYNPSASSYPPPDCWSEDGINGNPDASAFAEKKLPVPSGNCLSCAYNEWGSAELIDKASPSGRGKACAEKVLVFMVRPNSSIPCVVALPPTAIQPARRYLMIRLGERNLSTYQLETKITVDDGKVTFDFGEELPEASLKGVERFAQQFAEMVRSLRPEETAELAAEEAAP